MIDIPRCKTCKHWQEPHAYGIGRCEIKLGPKLEFVLKTGWDGGFVQAVDTDEDFGCVEHEEKP